MKNTEVQMLVQLREYAREAFDQIEGKGNPIAQTPSRDVAYTLSSIVKSIDEVIKPYVKIREKALKNG